MGASPAIVRGYQSRVTNFQEKLQWGYINAVAAAAGCILAQPEIDDGVDVIARHQADIHTAIPDLTARLEIQLKATSQFIGSTGNGISVQVTQDRWRYFRSHDPTIAKIFVILSMPVSQTDWIAASDDIFSIRHCAYWVNVSDLPDSDAANPTITAPKSQIFDDVSLCEIMARLGQGRMP